VKVSLNIGCGDQILKDISGFKCINIDIRPLDGVDIICDVKRLPFSDDCFERILASDIIEHFPLSETEKLLKEWARVLKPSGHIKFRTPSLKWVARHYLATGDAKFVSWHIFGGQDYDTNFHYVIFDNVWLSSLCSKFGLETIDYKENHSNFELVLSKI
jgi:predicted SAM-dependent methyltransferase